MNKKNRMQRVMDEISEYISCNGIPFFELEGYYGFAYLSYNEFDRSKDRNTLVKIKFDYVEELDEVQILKNW
jgi:hypothetical protein